jgi:predicted nicotinamide N-methyase
VGLTARVPADSPVPAAFVRAHTRPVRPALVPEVELLVAADVVALWEAMETEHGRTSTDPPFWAAAWPGGQALARYVLDHPELVAGRSVLDLGAGSGLVAVAAVRAGATAVLASDVDPFALTAVAVNAERNGAAGITPVGDVLGGEPPDVAVILAGDVCYDREMTDRVLPFLDAARRRGVEVLVGDPGRIYLPEDRLAALAVYDVPDTEPSPAHPAVRRTTVWRLP